VYCSLFGKLSSFYHPMFEQSPSADSCFEDLNSALLDLYFERFPRYHCCQLAMNLHHVLNIIFCGGMKQK
jgi:hypothetical protein